MIHIDLNKYDIPDDEYIVVGVSAGPDSMALLNYLKDIHSNTICCHVNHKIRKESDEEELYLKKYCKENNIIFEKTELSGYKEGSLENQARIKRYKFYCDILKKYNSHYLFLAHHGDDLIETVLMKISRGSNIEGYSGIKEEKRINTNDYSYTIIRPFIYFTKDDLIEYNEINNIKYFIDKTNYEDEYTRNRYRKYVLPFLKKEDKNIHLKYLKFSNTLIEYCNFINAHIEKLQSNIVRNNKIDINLFNNLQFFEKKNLIYKLLNNIYNCEISFKDNHINNIINLTKTNGNKFINLPNNFIAIKEYNTLTIQHKKEKIDNYYKILFNNIIKINNYIIKTIESSNEDGNDICRLDSNTIKLPLYFRNVNNKDKMEVLGLNGHKKIKEIFNEYKISSELRVNYPILVDSNDNILWLPKLKKSKFNVKKGENYDIILKCIEKENKNEK